MTETIVVNLRKEPADEYIGRGSIFGNPFKISKYRTREMVIDFYREWFYEQLKQDWFRKAVERLEGKSLGCFCKPKACHGDIIVEYLTNHSRQNDGQES